MGLRVVLPTLEAMNDTDLFFTETIVGAPFSVRLGRAIGPGSKTSGTQGLEVQLGGTERRFSPAWLAWLRLQSVRERAGQPRRLPGRWRQWLERHALVFALTGLLSTAVNVLIWGGMSWH